jgi:hypothetical protein
MPLFHHRIMVAPAMIVKCQEIGKNYKEFGKLAFELDALPIPEKHSILEYARER